MVKVQSLKVAIAETCNGQDDNCNGQTDDGMADKVDSSGFDGVGICQAEIQKCLAGGYKVTQTKVVQSPELCNKIDDDCNGKTDDGIADKVDSSGFDGIGICQAGIEKCIGGNYTKTQTKVPPKPEELYGNGLDDNCNGKTDESGANCDTDGDGVVTDRFKDENFLAAIRTFLGKGPSEDITMKDVLGVKVLKVVGKNISDASGAECFTNVTTIDFSDNDIADFSPVANLSKLSVFVGNNNQSLSNLSFMKGLLSLSWIGLKNNPLIAALDGLIDNPGIGQGDQVDITGDFNVSATQKKQLKDKGVNVIW